jgi:Spy/CpxP family protein refolding chaperone
MKNPCRLALVFGLAVLIASPALAQRQRGSQPRGERPPSSRSSSLFLLSQESVQKELQLSDDQVAKVKDLEQKQREAFRGLRDLSREERQKKTEEQAKATRKAVSDVLKAEQQKRLEQISLQLAGARALSRSEVADTLKLTSEQKDKIKTIQEEARKERAGLRGNNNEDARKKSAEIRKSSDEKVMNVLTTEQKSKLKELSGEPFKGEIRTPQRRGGERRGGQSSRR